MARTEKEIQADIIELVKDDRLSSLVSGAVYRDGLRPRDSRLEDIVVVFTAGNVSGGEELIQQGTVTVLVYCPDIAPWNNGVYVEDAKRIETLERIAQDWVDSLTCEVSNYKFRLRNAIHSVPIYDIRQHAISIALDYDYYGSPDDEEALFVTENDEKLIGTGTPYFRDKEAGIIQEK